MPFVRNRPGHLLAIIRAGGTGSREAVSARLGLIPAWAKDPAIGSRMINARAETVTEKAAFRDPFACGGASYRRAASIDGGATVAARSSPT